MLFIRNNNNDTQNEGQKEKSPMSTCLSSNPVEGRKVLSADDAKKERLIENSPNGYSTGTLSPVCARRRTPSLPCTCGTKRISSKRLNLVGSTPWMVVPCKGILSLRVYA